MSSEATGVISHERSGLPCRADLSCDFTVRVWPQNDAAVLACAAATRSAHETEVHHYTHVVVGTFHGAALFAQRMRDGKRRLA